MIPRDIQIELARCQREYPVLCITGPRQSGKTTLARSFFSELSYVSFEEPLTRDVFLEDPKGFLHRYREGAIFDEAQHVPDLFSYLQVMVDENPEAGRFVITGSQHFGLTQRISQSLAGRTAILELLPFSAKELTRGGWMSGDLDVVMWAGAYPPVHDRGLRPDRWYANYLATYIQRDVRQISQIHNLDIFTRFMRLCAGNSGQLLNMGRIGAECGVDSKTIGRWVTIVQASYIVKLVPPYYRNFRKRVVKTPKLFFYDTGLACYLLGIRTHEQLSVHPLRGALIETWAFSELNKEMLNQGEQPDIYFWRTHGGREVDFVFESGGQVQAVEVKAGMSVPLKAVRCLEKAISEWEGLDVTPWIVYGGEENMKVRACEVVSWKRFWERPEQRGDPEGG